MNNTPSPDLGCIDLCICSVCVPTIQNALDLAVSVKNEFRRHLLDLFSAEAEITSRMLAIARSDARR
jgi:hypothetical protein